MKRKYRIVKHGEQSYQIQRKFLCFWTTMVESQNIHGNTVTFHKHYPTAEHAEAFLRDHVPAKIKPVVVKELVI